MIVETLLKEVLEKNEFQFLWGMSGKMLRRLVVSHMSRAVKMGRPEWASRIARFFPGLVKVEKHKKGGLNCVLKIKTFCLIATKYAADKNTN